MGETRICSHYCATETINTVQFDYGFCTERDCFVIGFSTKVLTLVQAICLHLLPRLAEYGMELNVSSSDFLS